MTELGMRFKKQVLCSKYITIKGLTKMSADKIVCVGKNYLDHAMELGDDVPENPVLFLKPFSVLKQAVSWDEELNLYFPSDSAVQPECEIALHIAHDGFNMTTKEAKKAISVE